jgi:uncharacterized OB-fold protein
MAIDWSEGLPLNIGPIMVGLTETSPETAGYWDGVKRGELMIKRCAGCGRFLYPRRIFCPECTSSDMPWVRSAGTGEVYTFSTVYRAPSSDFVVPYTNGIVKLDEGVYLFGRLVGKSHESISIGDRVQVEFESLQADHDALPVYRVG